jgi:dGTP triphosphohydrolase
MKTALVVADYIAGLTDRSALEEHERNFRITKTTF